jgi:hypothetical protein
VPYPRAKDLPIQIIDKTRQFHIVTIVYSSKVKRPGTCSPNEYSFEETEEHAILKSSPDEFIIDKKFSMETQVFEKVRYIRQSYFNKLSSERFSSALWSIFQANITPDMMKRAHRSKFHEAKLVVTVLHKLSKYFKR